jgi:hypothetical protein
MLVRRKSPRILTSRWGMSFGLAVSNDVDVIW